MMVDKQITKCVNTMVFNEAISISILRQKQIHSLHTQTSTQCRMLCLELTNKNRFKE